MSSLRQSAACPNSCVARRRADAADSQPKPGTIWEEYGGSGSVNHPALTSFEPWFFNTLGGIWPARPGFARSIVAPQVRTHTFHYSVIILLIHP